MRVEVFPALAEIMTLEVLTISSESTILEAAERMSRHGVGSIVVESPSLSVGILTERDILHRVAARGRNGLEEPVHVLMSSPLKTMPPSTRLSDAIAFLQENRIRHLPIVDGKGNLKGIVTQTDLLKASLRSFHLFSGRINEIMTRTRDAFSAEMHERGERASMTAHDLKGPLSAISAFTKLFLDGSLGKLDERQAEAVRAMHESSEAMVELIERLLEVYELELGRFQLAHEQVDLAELVGRLVARYKSVAEKKGVRLSGRSEATVPRIHGDRRRLTEVLDNLITNALRHTDKGKAIEVTVRGEGEGALLEVRDEGAGIAPEDRKRIFEPFTRASRHLPGVDAGTGLGLTIVRRLVQLHGGRVEVSSRLGAGSVFTVHLPRDGKR